MGSTGPSRPYRRLIGAAVAWPAAVAAFAAGGLVSLAPVTAHLLAAITGAAVVIALIGRGEAGSGADARAWPALGRAVVAAIVAAAVQGALWWHLRAVAPESQLLAFTVAALGSIATAAALTLWYVYPAARGPDAAGPPLSGLAALLVAAIVIRLAYLGLPELMEQEAYYWNYARHPALSYLDHPPLTAWLIMFGTALFGTTEFGVRAGAFCSWFVAAWFVYRLARAVFDRRAAVGAVALYALLPLYFGVGFLMTPDAPLHAAWAALTYFSYRALIDDRPGAWLGVGVSLGLGLLAKYTIVLLGPALLGFILLDRRARPWLARPHPYLAAGLALLIFLPVIIWNLEHDWASFAFQGGKRIAGRDYFTAHKLLGYILLMLTPAGVWAAALAAARGRSVLVTAGNRTAASEYRWSGRTWLLLLLLAAVPLMVFAGFSLSREVKLNWASPVWLPLLPFLGCTAGGGGDLSTSFNLRRIRRLWGVTLPPLLAAFGLGLHWTTLGLPGLPHPRGPFLIGWGELAGEIDTVVAAVAADTGRRPIVVGMDHYQIASGLAFYRTVNAIADDAADVDRSVDETAGWHLFGYNSRMYRFWFEPAALQGRDVIAVASGRRRLRADFFPDGTIFAGDIVALDVRCDGEVVDRLYYRIVDGASVPP